MYTTACVSRCIYILKVFHKCVYRLYGAGQSQRVSHLEVKLGCARGVISAVHWAGHGFPGHPIALGVLVCSAGRRLAHQSCCGDLSSGNEGPILPPSAGAPAADFCVPLDLVGRAAIGCQNGSAPATHSSCIVQVAPWLHRIRRGKGKAGSQSQRLCPRSGREVAELVRNEH